MGNNNEKLPEISRIKLVGFGGEDEESVELDESIQIDNSESNK